MEGKISIDRLQSLLAYDTDTGALTWRVSRGRIRAGSIAGCPDGQGYWHLTIDYKTYSAHVVAWALYHGSWPSSDLDHRNGKKSDNRIDNLRLATTSQNAANKKTPSTNTSGRKGVTWNTKSGKWQAQVKVAGKNKYLGLYDDPDKAHEAYMKAANDNFGQYARAQ